MPTYITLVNYTPKGIENVKESPQRLDAAKKAFKGMGAELIWSWVVMTSFW